MSDVNNKESNIIYWLFKYLWIIILMPKYVQLLILSLIIILLFLRNDKKIYIDDIVLLHIIFFFINVTSIVINSLNVSSFDRILAGINTALLWLYAGLFYGFYKKIRINKIKVIKYMSFNMFIFIALAFLMIICKYFNWSSPEIFSRTLFRSDWLASGKTIRFKGFMEYPNLGVFFYMLCFPFFFEYVNQKRGALIKILLLALSTIPPILTNSRMGIFAVLFIVYLSILNIDLFKIDKNKKKLVNGLVLICTFTFILFNFSNLYNKAYSIIYSRDASTSTRMNIYIKSIERTLEKNVFIGCGIKEMIGNYPLGSHSTYIGIFYKTGIIGFIIFAIAFCSLLVFLYQSSKKTNKLFLKFLPIFMTSFMLALEDLDGSNWLIVLFYSIISILCSKSFTEVNTNE